MTGKTLLLLLTSTNIILLGSALHCDKQFDYYDDYGHGFDITCQGITKEYLYILSNITIINEISLTIDNSTLMDVTNDIFQKVQHLRRLYIENSTFTYPVKHQIFNLLNNLETLVIRNTEIKIVQETFVGLGKVKTLTLTNNNLTIIGTGALKNLPGLQHLEITNNHITNINNLRLCEAEELKFLNLSGNLIRELSEETFHCTHEVAATIDLNLNNKNVMVNAPHRDYNSVLSYILELDHLDLSSNQIKSIGDALTALKFLKVLKLQNNSLLHLSDGDLMHLPDLEELHLQNNKLHDVSDKIFEDKDYLEYVDLSVNKLKSFSLNDAPSLKYLNLAFNELSAVDFLNFVKLKSLKTLILSNNLITILDGSGFQNVPSLEKLDLSNNQIVLKDDSFTGLSLLETLLLKNNSLNVLPDKVFDSLQNLHYLDLSYNKLQQINNTDVFKQLKLLETLNMSFNLLEHINYSTIQHLENLHVLDVSGNKLKYIEYSLILSKLPLISVLNIKSNELSCNFLSKIVDDLKSKNVSFTLTEKFDYSGENVAGISCTNDKTDPQMNVSARTSNSNNSIGIFVQFCIGIGVVALLLCSSIAFYKFHVYLKRRKYRADEFELINE